MCEGPSKSIYKRYGLKNSESNDLLEYEKRLENVRKHASNESLEILNKLSLQYEKTYGLWF